MKKLMIATVALAALTFGAAKAQDKMQKKAEVVAAKGQVAADKADMKAMKAEKKMHKAMGNDAAVKEDNKKMMKGEANLTKDQIKKDAKQVKAKF